MTVRVEPFEEERGKRFADLVSEAKEVLIVSPFVSVQAANLLLGNNKDIRMITRFNLEDFFGGVSHLHALEILAMAGVRIRGLCGLHSKLYIFDRKTLIVTSANLTSGGLIHNLEFGLEVEGHEIVASARSYFDRLWGAAGENLTLARISKWKDEVDNERVLRGQHMHPRNQLPDYGIILEPQSPVEVILPNDPISVPARIGAVGIPSVFVKFFGTSKDRWDAQRHVREAIEDSECYYACTYPRNKRPRRIRHNDIIYMAFMTKNPVDYAIFGKAVAIPHHPGRDDATPNEIARLSWKNDWPYYVRVFDPVFIDASLSNCVRLGPIIDKLGPRVFASTALNMIGGKGNIDPRKSLKRKPDVKLTVEASALISQQFEQTLQTEGRIPNSFIKKLPKSDIQLNKASIAKLSS